MPSDTVTLTTLARQAALHNDWARVDAAAREILRQDNASSEGHFLAGLVAKAARKPKVAVQAFSRALELDAERYEAAVELATQHSIARRNGEAAALLRRYEDRLDGSPRYLDMAATTYTEIGMPERAWPLYSKAYKLQPEASLFQSNLAACGVYLGKIDEARALYLDLIERNPGHQRNHYHLSRLATATDSRHVDQMREVLAAAEGTPDKNVFLYYALGKELEDLQRWDEAFEYYRKAGDAVTSVARYDIGEDLALIDTIIDVCDAGWLAQGPPRVATRVKGKTPIFIVGLPRTGTTLTDRIISSHSDVVSVGETLFLQMVLRRESGVSSTQPMNAEIIRAAAARDIGVIADGYLDSVEYRLGEQPMFIDKLPLNIYYLGFIAKAFPDARIVLMNRHPMDACFSMYKQVFTWAYKFSYTLQGLGAFYPAFDRLRQHWRQVLGPRLIEVSYEALVSDQEAQTRRLLELLGLDFQQACLEFDRNEAASATASSVQIRQKIHSGSVARWQRFADDLEPLRRELEAAGVSMNDS